LRLWQAAGTLLIIVGVAVIGSNNLSQFASGIVHGKQAADSASGQIFHSAPPAPVCGTNAVLGGGPTSPPSGAVSVPTGNDAGVDLARPHTVYWFAPGKHTLGPGIYRQVDPGEGSTFIGAPGAILDGQHENYYAFGGVSSNVRIRYLTVENFGALGGNNNEGVVNHNSAPGWAIDHSTITLNAGAGVMLGSDNTLSYDCLSDNQQYGFNAYSPTGPVNLVLDHNQISGNDTYNWESKIPGCGCTGGGKFWDVTNAVITDNWIDGNHSTGLWADTDNRGFEIKGNYISDNYSYGLVYEISYNALVEGNTFVRNGLGEGPKNPGFPTSAIYLSESGSDPNVPGPYNKTLEISDNKFIDNWGGVTLWENSNRFCNSPANTSSGACTLDNPGVVNLQSCNAGNLKSEPYYSECRWKTENVSVDHNVFDFAPTDLGASCTPANDCGLQGIFSEWGTYPTWSPYLSETVEKAITFGQNNSFSSNDYTGPWSFVALEQGNTVSWAQWRSIPYRQDQGSTLNPVS
jgi:hypothetical protein